MPFDVARTFAERSGDNFALHARYLNPQLTQVVTTLGFDRFYERGEGCYLFDDERSNATSTCARAALGSSPWDVRIR